MKTVYLVRHGESEGNVGDFMQTIDTPLSQKGIEQSQKIASRLSKLKFDIVITSSATRTLQTAELINSTTGHPFVVSELFLERRRPSRQANLKKDSELNLEIEKEFISAFKKGDKYEDAESFSEIRDRAVEALKFLENYPADKIVVVSHGTFSRVMAAVMLVGAENLTAETCYRIIKIFKKMNTGVTILEKSKKWRIKSWNDVSHFANEDEK